MKKLLEYLNPMTGFLLLIGVPLAALGVMIHSVPVSVVGGAMTGSFVGISVVAIATGARREAANKAWAASMAAAHPPAASFPPGLFWPTISVPEQRKELIVKGKLFIFGDGKILLALDGTEITHEQFDKVKEALDNWAADPMVRSMIIAGVEVEIITPEVKNATTVLSEA